LPARPRSTARYGSDPMTTLLLARHGETDWNREGRWQGWADPPLNDTGRAQARRLADELRALAFDAVYSSDLRRAFETAEILAEPHGVPIVADPGLREIDVGSWSGLTRAEIGERFPDGERPDGETHEEHGGRVRTSVMRIARRHLGGRILLVGHGGTIRSIHDVISDLPYHPVPNCHVLEVHFRDDRLSAPR
jgi:broad specificity phosphatase PhoE